MLKKSETATSSGICTVASPQASATSYITIQYLFGCLHGRNLLRFYAKPLNKDDF